MRHANTGSRREREGAGESGPRMEWTAKGRKSRSSGRSGADLKLCRHVGTQLRSTHRVIRSFRFVSFRCALVRFVGLFAVPVCLRDSSEWCQRDCATCSCSVPRAACSVPVWRRAASGGLGPSAPSAATPPPDGRGSPTISPHAAPASRMLYCVCLLHIVSRVLYCARSLSGPCHPMLHMPRTAYMYAMRLACVRACVRARVRACARVRV
jgi:hypothetical protein